MDDEDHDDHDHHPHGSAGSRSTAPQSEYTTRQTLVGAAIALVGLAVTFGVPLAVLL
jgi:hypothetical protein